MTTGNSGPLSGPPETNAQASHAPGSLFAGKYVIEKVMGQGGMGVVLAARHSHLQEQVAIKCLLPQFTANRDVVARFVQEARAARRIRSEHVVRIDDVDTLDSGTPYIVMECLQGQDLEQLVAGSGPLSVVAAIDFVTQALEALAEAHALGIVHRDLKPANLFLTRRADGSSCIKVLDFGISKVASAARSTESGRTKSSAMLGSPHYMSPEQIRSSRDVDARSDIWAIGVIVHELLTASLPFDSETIPDLFVRILTEAPRPLSQLRGDIPAALERTVLRCLEKDAARRFANVAELATALAETGSTASRTSAERISRVLQGHLQTALAVPAVAPPMAGSTSPGATPYPNATPSPGAATSYATPYPGAATPYPNPTPYRPPTQPGEPVGMAPAAQTGFSASRTNGDPVASPKRNVPAIAAGGVAVVAVLALVGVVAYSAGSHRGNESGPAAAAAPDVAGMAGAPALDLTGTAGAGGATAPSGSAGEDVPPLAPVVATKAGLVGQTPTTGQTAAGQAAKAHALTAPTASSPAATRSLATTAAATNQPASQSAPSPAYTSGANAPLPPPPSPRSAPADEEEDRPSHFHQFFNGIGQGFRRSVHRATE